MMMQQIKGLVVLTLTIILTLVGHAALAVPEVANPKYDMHEYRVEQVKEGVKKAEQQLKEDQQQLIIAKVKEQNSLASFVATIAQREHNGQIFKYEDLEQQESNTVKQVVKYTRQLRSKYNCLWLQAAQVAMIIETITEQEQGIYLSQMDQTVQNIVAQEKKNKELNHGAPNTKAQPN